jgi:hypothetical protein
VEALPAGAQLGSLGRPALRTAAAVALAAALAFAWLAWRGPLPEPAPAFSGACNGKAALCERRVEEVAFAGTHNSMSNTAIRDWMFPHHQSGIPQQIQAGVRALLVDVYYGFPGAARIKTDLSADRPNAEKLRHAIGDEGVAAALRIRDRLVGVDEGRRGLFFCHGFCELGAYEIVPTLREIRDFLVARPGEVLLIVVEDYVSPQDLAGAFEESGLAQRVYRGASGPPWPRLAELVAAGENAIVFLESGKPGVPWLRPAFELMQDTPYTFHAPEEFSCRLHRGPADAALFLVNHWIETTPTPLPSNAALVNAHGVLLPRARACQRERGRLSNILAVDFYGVGDLLRVVDELNGAPNA